MAKPRLGRHFRLQWEEVQQAWVLLYPEGMVKLNGSAGEILRHCDGNSTVAQIVDRLETQFGASGLRDDVDAFLAIASKQRWVELEVEVEVEVAVGVEVKVEPRRDCP